MESNAAKLKSQVSGLESQNSALTQDLKLATNQMKLAEKEADGLQASLDRASKELDKLKSEKDKQAEVKSQPKYAKNPKYEYTSVCKVLFNPYKGYKMLKRIADVDENGEITQFFQDNGPKTFSNRDWLYMSNSENVSENMVAVWDWNAKQSGHNPEKDFVTSSLNINFKPIVRINGIFQISELDSVLKSGLPVPTGYSKFMLVVQQEKDCYGVVIDEGDYNIVNGILRITPDVVCLPKYKVSDLDFISLVDETYYRFMNLKNFAGFEMTKDFIKAVKDIIVRRATRKAFVEYGFNTKEWSGAKKFIEDLPTDDLLEEIAQKFKCTSQKAKEYLDKFLHSATGYFDGSSDENQALLSVINSSSELQKRCVDIVRGDWEKQNSDMIEKSNMMLNGLSESVEKKRLELSDIEAQISQKEELAKEVDKAVTEQIQNAQNNAAKFIAKMAFVQPLASKNYGGSNSCCAVKSGHKVDSAKCKSVKSFEDWLDVCYANFSYAGISADEFGENLAAFMYTACEEKIPLILSGPNAKEIADAFSYSRFGKTAAYVNCTCEFSNDTIGEIIQLPSEIVVIDNAFSMSWASKIMSLINSPEKFYILIQPFSENLLLEPKGILNYAIPLLTELISEKIANKIEYTEPLFDSNFKFIEVDESVKYDNKNLRDLSIGIIAKNRLKLLLGNMEALSENSAATEFVLGIIPSAYISGQIEIIKNALSTQNLGISTTEAFKALMGVENDNAITNA